MKPPILLVDDEANVLQAYARVLRNRFALATAEGGGAALELLAAQGPFAVVVSDMRMPGIDGVEFLTLVKERYPDTIRIMLTGNADQATASEAVNKGEIFRFLNKPCDTELLVGTLDQAVRQYELLTAEKALLEGTLKGSIRMLVDLLSLLDPISFGRAREMGDLAEGVAKEMGMEDSWVLGIASVLSQIGLLTLPEGVASRIHGGAFLNSQEREFANRIPEIGADLIRNIPRLDEVAEAVRYMNKNFNGSGYPTDELKEDSIPLGGRILRVVWDFERQAAAKGTGRSALAEMMCRTAWYDLEVLRALGRHLQRSAPGSEPPVVRQVPLHELRTGQLLVKGIETLEGLLVLPEGTRLNQAQLQKLRNFSRMSGIREPLLVTEG